MALHKLRHYIFIDPKNIHSHINESKLLEHIKCIHHKQYINGEIVKYYGYNDIGKLLKKFDKQLYELFVQLNYNYPALLADIGRYVILYYYGGIYHDLKFMSNKKLIDYLENISTDIELICEEHPLETHRIRNGNIISLKKKHNYFAKILNKIKSKLIVSNNAYGPNVMYEIGSGLYIDEFKKNKCKNIIKVPFLNKNMIVCDNYIYGKNTKTWQNTYEAIFRL